MSDSILVLALKSKFPNLDIQDCTKPNAISVNGEYVLLPNPMELLKESAFDAVEKFEQAILNKIQEELEAGKITFNQARGWLGLEPIDGGDIKFVNNNDEAFQEMMKLHQN